MTMPKLELPDSGVTVRMYRQGHGDCFLLAMPRDGGGDPVYILIDCGYKPGSPAYLHDKTIGEIVEHIGESTGRHLDLMILTHEHQDHLNGIWKKTEPYFDDFLIDEAWVAWTEDPRDDMANDLRERHRDQLLQLVAVRRKLALAAGEDDPTVQRLDGLLALELGGEDEALALAADTDPANSVNKQGMKLVKDKANQHRGVKFLQPGEKPRQVPQSADIRAFVLGPPRNPDLLSDEDPIGDEAFPRDDSQGLSFSAAAFAMGDRATPFSTRYRVALEEALDGEEPEEPFFVAHYGKGKDGEDDTDGIEVPPNAAWRRIDDEWLYSAESLALSLNTGVNNTSLVLAFELPASKKVLLFIGDAQRGNWISWADLKWNDGDETITARDLLSRTVLYKVGHHGSHNATLAGTVDDVHPNLDWMGLGEFAGEFTAMIPAVNEWAVRVKPPWYHPLPSIRSALLKRAQGRVLQMDIDQPEKPESVPADAWAEFTTRVVFDDLYFDYVIPDE
jgi:beta-lactamase superfamily II metal-dependent hydrolase